MEDSKALGYLGIFSQVVLKLEVPIYYHYIHPKVASYLILLVKVCYEGKKLAYVELLRHATTCYETLRHVTTRYDML